MDSLRNIGALLGRIMLAYIFVVSGTEKLLGAVATMNEMTHAGLPQSFVPELFVLTVIVELLGGLMLVVGWYADVAALIMLLWFIPVTWIFHVQTGQTIEWQKNLAIMGGFLLLAVYGPGPISLGPSRLRRAN